jgi:hypothetical protein
MRHRLPFLVLAVGLVAGLFAGPPWPTATPPARPPRSAASWPPSPTRP